MGDNSRIKMAPCTMTAKQAAQYLGISYWLILELVKKKQIPCIDLGGRKLFRKETLDKWMGEKEQAVRLEYEKVEHYGVLRKLEAR